MIAILEELLAKLFGAKDNVAIPVRVDDDRPSDKFVRPARGRQ